MLPGTTPSRPDDTGAGDPAFASALSSRDVESVRTLLLTTRLLVPVVALPAEGEAEMAVPALIADDGRRALPVFSSYDALRAWRPDARPVPMTGARVVAGAVAEGYDGVVIDVAGPVAYTLQGDELSTLARAASALVTNPGVQVAAVEEGR